MLDQDALRNLIVSGQLWKALLAQGSSSKIAKVDAALQPLITHRQGYELSEAQALVAAALALAVDEELPIDRRLELAAHRDMAATLMFLCHSSQRLEKSVELQVDVLDRIGLTLGDLPTAIAGAVQPITYREPYDDVIQAFESLHLPVRDRDDDLYKLSAIVHSAPGYLVVQGHMYAGKTALFTALRRRLVSEGCTVISFFIRRGTADTSSEFLPAVIGQLLIALAPIDPRLAAEGVAAIDEARRVQFADLWHRCTNELDHPIVLLIDGLDEQKIVHLHQSITNLLPFSTGRHGRVVLSTRLNPSFGSIAPLEHPLRTLKSAQHVFLDVSPHAAARREVVERELNRYLSSDDPTNENIAAMYALAGPPLSDADLADFLGRTPGQISNRRQQISASLIKFTDTDLLGNITERFQFGHEAQRQYVRDHLGHSFISELAERILVWADRYAKPSKGIPWPDSTPIFLRDHLHTFISRSGFSNKAQLLEDLATRSRLWLHIRTKGHVREHLTAVDLAFEAASNKPMRDDALLSCLRIYAHRVDTLPNTAGITGTLLRPIALAGRLNQALEFASTLPQAIDRTSAYLEIADTLANRGMNEEARSILKKAAQAVVLVDDSWERTWMIKEVASEFGRIGAADEARRIAMRNRDSFHVDLALLAAARALAEAGQALEARATALEIADPGSRNGMLVSVAAVLADAGRIDDAREVALTIEEAADRSRALASIAHALADAGRLPSAREIALTIDAPVGRAQALASIARALAQAGRIDESRDEGLQASRAAQSITEGRSKDFESILGELALAGHADQMLEIAKMIPRLEERAKAISAAARYLIDKGSNAQAYAFTQEARKVLNAVEDNRERESVLSEIAVTLGRLGYTSESLMITNALENKAVRSDALEKISEAFARRGRSHDALRAAMAVDESGGARNSVLSRVAEGLVEAGRTAEACKVALSIGSDSGRSYALAQIAIKLAQIGQVDKARTVGEKISIARDQARALAAIAEALAVSDRSDRALATALQAIECTREDPWRSPQILMRFVSTLAQLGLFDDAKNLAGQIEGSLQQFDALAAIAQFSVKVGRTNEVREAALRSTDIQRPDDAFSLDHSLRRVAESLVAVGDLEPARNIALDIENTVLRAAVLARIAMALQRTGKQEQAKELVHVARDELSDGGHLDLYLSSIPEPGVRVAEAFIAVHEVDGALELLNEMTRMIIHPAFADSYLACSAMSRFAKELTRIGQEAWAHQLVGHALKMAEAQEDSYDKAKSLASISEAIVELGQFDEAASVARNAWEASTTIGPLGPRGWAQVEITYALSKAQSIEEARKMAMTIEEDGSRARALIGMLHYSPESQERDQLYSAALEAMRVVPLRGGISEQAWSIVEIARWVSLHSRDIYIRTLSQVSGLLPSIDPTISVD